MRVFDAHVHVDRGFETYDLAVVGKNLIFNDVASYRKECTKNRTKSDSVSLILDLGSDAAFVRSELASGRVDAVKIHSRIQRIGQEQWPAVLLALTEIPERVPVIVDSFYFGADLNHQPSLKATIDLLEAFPERRFVIAHSGGYRILEYFFHLREFTNCYYELALSLQYLADSSTFADLKKLVRHTDKSRILFGSDFPYGSPAGQVDCLLSIADDLNMPENDLHDILYRNAASLFGRVEA